MIRVTINGLTIEGSDEKAFAFALSQVANVASLAAEHGAHKGAQVPRGAESGKRFVLTGKGSNVAQYMALMAEKAEAQGVKAPERFRRSKAEIDAGLNEEDAAAERLQAMGESVGGAGGAGEGATLADGQFDDALASEFGGAEDEGS